MPLREIEIGHIQTVTEQVVRYFLHHQSQAMKLKNEQKLRDKLSERTVSCQVVISTRLTAQHTCHFEEY